MKRNITLYNFDARDKIRKAKYDSDYERLKMLITHAVMINETTAEKGSEFEKEEVEAMLWYLFGYLLDIIIELLETDKKQAKSFAEIIFHISDKFPNARDFYLPPIIEALR